MYNHILYRCAASNPKCVQNKKWTMKHTGQRLKGRHSNQQTVCQVPQSSWEQGFWNPDHGQKEAHARFLKFRLGCSGNTSVPIYCGTKLKLPHLMREAMCQSHTSSSPNETLLLLNLGKLAWILLCSDHQNDSFPSAIFRSFDWFFSCFWIMTNKFDRLTKSIPTACQLNPLLTVC